jgi:CHAT domain-containing protein
VVPLGAASVIEPLVVRWHEQATGVLRASTEADAEQNYRAAGTAVRNRVWDPLRAHLEGASTVFVVPDGALNLLSLAALPVGQSRYLIESGPVIHYLSAERDLVIDAAAPNVNRGLLAVGGAAFDDPTLFTANQLRPSPAGPSSGTSGSTTRGACGDLQSLRFDPLAATANEVLDVAGLWGGSPVQLLQDRNASERAFKQAAPGRRVLHLATHGFFLGSECEPTTGATRGIGGLASTTQRKPGVSLTDSPLLLSGLALAGANRREAAGPKDEDGILTAEEVAGLDLDGVEWAVLSACDTGLGEVRAGEGVFGLRRAFQMAGVHTVIMSLWSVDDRAAREWMRVLYEGRLKKKLTTADAVQRASLTVLQARRAAGESTHPFYWAAFVAAGNWR